MISKVLIQYETQTAGGGKSCPEHFGVLYQMSPALNKIDVREIFSRSECSIAASLAITDSEHGQMIRSIAHDLITFTFHPGYIFRRPGVPVLLVNSEFHKSICVQLQDLFIKHGYDGVHLCYRGSDHANTEQSFFYTLNNDHSLVAGYQALLEHKLQAGDFIIISGVEHGQEAGIMRHLTEVESKLHQSSARLYYLLESTANLDQALNKSLTTLKMNEEQLTSLQSYMSSATGAGFTRKQVKEISEFYKYEYEILPTWFKQLGHLLKVMMGKRTFRSLYDDNAKKYRT